MFSNRHVRWFLGILLGGLAGVSLCLSILPTLMAMIGAGDQSAIAYRLSPYVVYTALVWAAGGWSVTRAGVSMAGAFILAVVGLATGILLAWFGLGGEMRLLATGAFGGMVYGFLGGLILGRVLSAPPTGEAESE